MAELGVLGGTFNPPHVGHLICAHEALEQLGLDHVLLVPTGEPPHKEIAADPGAEVRVELCELAVADDPRMSVSRLDVDRAGPSFTVDTLRALHAERTNDALTFIVGGDMAASLPTWRDPEAILSLATFGVAERAGARRADIEERLATLTGGGGGRVRFFDMPRIDISSSLVRRLAAGGRSVRYLVPDGVAARIAERGIYRAVSRA